MPDPSPSAPNRPSIASLFLSFLGISLMGFGGVLPWARWMVVEKRGWLTPAEFNEILALCQFLPGGNITNFGVIVGGRFGGWIGSIAAVSGMMLGPFFIVIGLAWTYAEFADAPGVSGLLRGFSAAAVGLIVAMTIKMIVAMRGEWVPLLFAAAGFVAVGLLRVPLVWAVAVLVPVTVLYAWRRLT